MTLLRAFILNCGATSGAICFILAAGWVFVDSQHIDDWHDAIPSMGIWMRRENKRRNKAQGVNIGPQDVKTEYLAAGPESPLFRYMYWFKGKGWWSNSEKDQSRKHVDVASRVLNSSHLHVNWWQKMAFLGNLDGSINGARSISIICDICINKKRHMEHFVPRQKSSVQNEI